MGHTHGDVNGVPEHEAGGCAEADTANKEANISILYIVASLDAGRRTRR